MEVDDTGQPCSVGTVIDAFLSPSGAKHLLCTRPKDVPAVLLHLAGHPRTELLPDCMQVVTSVAAVLEDAPWLWPFAAEAIPASPAPFAPLLEQIEGCRPSPPKMARLESSEDAVWQEKLLKACLVLVKTHGHFRKRWPWHDLLVLLKSRPVHVLSVDARFLISEVLGYHLQLQESTKRRLLGDQVSTEEYQRLCYKHLLQEQCPTRPAVPPQSGLHSRIEHEAICWVSDVPLLKKKWSAPSDEASPLVQLPSVKTRLRNLALSVLRGCAVLLSGPMGCGKTALVEHLVSVTGRKEHVDFHRIQVSAHTDGRGLLGGYVCSDVPGQFTWRRGVLARAAEQGHWVLVEDVDLAGSDVIAALLPLLKSRMLDIPGKESIEAAPGFYLFLTQRDDHRHQRFSFNADKTVIPAYTLAEMKEILSTRFPKVEPVLSAILSATHLERPRRGASGSYRQVSLRDLLFWADRCTRTGFKLTNNNLFWECLQTFAAHISDHKLMKEVAANLGHALQRTDDIINYYMEEFMPAIVHREDTLLINNVSYQLPPQRANNGLEYDASTPYTITRQTAKLLDFLAASVFHSQPVLLVGETGVGKTTTIQYLSKMFHKEVIVINLSSSTEATDLFGGFKPVDFEHAIRPIVDDFRSLCCDTFSKKKNAAFLGEVSNLLHAKCWPELLTLVVKVCELALKQNATDVTKRDRWAALSSRFRSLEATVVKSKASNMFAYVTGVLSNAMRDGKWVLLDEVNMADGDTLQSLNLVLSDAQNGHLALQDEGDTIVKISPDFRLFACMNPSTDIGKKDLPDGLRSRFVEFYLQEPKSRKELRALISSYLDKLQLPTDVITSIVQFYISVKKLCRLDLSDGTGKKPSFSLRTLCRSLGIAARNQCKNVERSLLEAFSIGFLTELDRNSYPLVLALVHKQIIGAFVGKGSKKAKAKKLDVFRQPLPELHGAVNVEGYWIPCGENEPNLNTSYILTDTVRSNLKDLARIVALSNFPILVQGETSVGKTSLITYLAEATGHKAVRINNHQHTDLQEYVGTYATALDGSFYFKEGVLAEAMRRGHWLILDELNLASSEILEALNRVLDDNRELFIQETQTIVKASPEFRIFATQNPAGSYGGRKSLSRAFRNRFIELHFGLLQTSELETIIEKKANIPRSISKKMIRVMHQLQLERKSSDAFQGKHGFITLRDLFRWANRYTLFEPPEEGGAFYDWDRHMTEEGFLVLASRLRKSSEREIVQSCLEKVFKQKIAPQAMFSEGSAFALKREIQEINSLSERCKSSFVWTKPAIRMAVLLLHSFRFKEPVLLVGETGGGKTSVCQTISEFLHRRLFTVNCHLNTDATDFLGSLRPFRNESPSTEARNQLFEWSNGPLVNALEEGGVLLIDEVSLADDSVIERLNSVLEEDKKLVLPERPHPEDGSSVIMEIVAHKHFRVCATMNPSGDFGKKELSPALRNRFLEIWCPSTTDACDVRALIRARLGSVVPPRVVDHMVEYISWIRESVIIEGIVSVRDIMCWCDFIAPRAETSGSSTLDLECKVIHGVALTFLDGLECYDLSPERIAEIKQGSFCYFQERFLAHKCDCFTWLVDSVACSTSIGRSGVRIGPFHMPSSSSGEDNAFSDYHFNTPSVSQNIFRVLRGLRSNKPLLLEGPPGAGKSVLVGSLAKATANELVRINLSEQTDLSDLFGSDLPSENEALGAFSWHDGPVLSALKRGAWILLDELNLATQSVLEGLNACLDHRGEIFIPELNRTFLIRSSGKTRIFATQNPSKHSGRKTLPKSFLNRFAKVYMKPLQTEDVVAICRHRFPDLSSATIEHMARSVEKLRHEVEEARTIGLRGSPWQFNLRDLLRWCEGVLADPDLLQRYGKLLLTERFRSESDQTAGKELLQFAQQDTTCCWNYSDKHLQIGCTAVTRNPTPGPVGLSAESASYLLLQEQLPILEGLQLCVTHTWIPILVGASGAGKSALVEILAQLSGKALHTITLNASSDTSELLGTFEQSDPRQKVERLVNEAHKALRPLLNSSDIATGALITALEEMKTASVSSLSACVEQLRSLGNEHSEIGACLEPLREALSSVSTDHSLMFEWVDSALVDAIEHGKWVVLDNANFCSASVLDRLNGLFEAGGSLALGEQGCGSEGVRRVKPHPDFRIFLLIDPAFGELSPAMRNRGVEMFVGPDYSKQSLAKIQEYVLNGVQEAVGEDLTAEKRRVDVRKVESYLTGAAGKRGKAKWLSIQQVSLHPTTYQAFAQTQLLKKFVSLSPHQHRIPAIQTCLKFATREDVLLRKHLLESELGLPASLTERLIASIRDGLDERRILDAGLMQGHADSCDPALKPLLAIDLLSSASAVDLDFDARKLLASLNESFEAAVKSLIGDREVAYFDAWRLSSALSLIQKHIGQEKTAECMKTALKLASCCFRAHLETLSGAVEHVVFPRELQSMSSSVVSRCMPRINGHFCATKPLSSAEAALRLKATLSKSSQLRPTAARELDKVVSRVRATKSAPEEPDRDALRDYYAVHKLLISDYVATAQNYFQTRAGGGGGDLRQSDLYPLMLRTLVSQRSAGLRCRSLLTAHAVQRNSVLALLQNERAWDDAERLPCAVSPTALIAQMLLPLEGGEPPLSLTEDHLALISLARKSFTRHFDHVKSLLVDRSAVVASTALHDFEQIALALGSALGAESQLAGAVESQLAGAVSCIRAGAGLPRDIVALLESGLSFHASRSELLKLRVINSLLLFWIVTEESLVDASERGAFQLRLIDSESTQGLASLRTELSCATMSFEPDARKGLSYHPRHRQLEALLESNEIAKREVSQSIPVRTESHRQLEAELRRLQTGLFSPGYVHRVLQDAAEAKESSSSSEGRVRSWIESLVHFIEALPEDYPSYVDLWSLANWAVSEAIEAVSLLHSSSAHAAEPSAIARLTKHCRGEAIYAQYGEADFAPISAIPKDFSAPPAERFYQFMRTSPESLFIQVVKKKALDEHADEDKMLLDFYRHSIKKIVDSSRGTISDVTEVMLLPSHLRALDAAWHRLTKLDGELDGLVRFSAEGLTPIALRVEKDLLSRWPENQLLKDITRAVAEIQAHSVFDSRSSFLMAFDDLAEKVSGWNRDAPSDLAINSALLTDKIREWKMRDYKDTLQTYDDAKSAVQQEAAAKSHALFRALAAMQDARDRDYLHFAVTSAALFLGSSCLADFEVRLRVVRFLSDVFLASGPDQRLAHALSRTARYFEQFLDHFLAAAEKARAKIRSQSVTVMKSFNTKDLRTFSQFAKQKKKLFSDALETLRSPLPKLSSKLDTSLANPPRECSEMALADELLAPDAHVGLNFYAANGDLLGTSSSMSRKAEQALARLAKASATFNEEKIPEMEEMRKAVQDSKSRYSCTKMIESFLKDLRVSEGLSSRIGSLARVTSKAILAQPSWPSRERLPALNACLSELDVLRDCLLQKRDPKKKQVTPRFISESTGLASHAALKIFHLSRELNRAYQDADQVRGCIEKLYLCVAHGHAAIRVEAVKRRLSEDSDALYRKLHTRRASLYLSEAHVSKLKTLAALVERNSSRLELSAAYSEEMSSALNEQHALLQELSSSVDLYFETYDRAEVRELLASMTRSCQSLKGLLAACSGPQHDQNKSHFHTPKATEMVRSLSKKCLVGIQDLKHSVPLSESRAEAEEADTVFTKMEALRVSLHSLQTRLVVRSLGEVVALVETGLGSGQCLGGLQGTLHELLLVLRVYYRGLVWLLGHCQSNGVSLPGRYLHVVLQTLYLFATKEFPEEEDEAPPEGREGQQEEQTDGCGLGEGKGDQATLEGVDSEDLFDEHRQEEEEEEKKENDDPEEQDKNKEEPSVDFSQDMDGENRDEDPRDDEEQDENEDEEDIENVERDECNENQDELRPDDWQQEDEDEEDRQEEEEESKDEVSQAPETTGQENEACSDQEADDDPCDDEQPQQQQPHEEDEEKRTRLPEEDDDDVVDSEMDDKQYGMEEEPECEDLDLPDDMNLNDEASEADSIADEQLDDRLPDFEDEQREPEQKEVDPRLEHNIELGQSDNMDQDENMQEDGEAASQEDDKGNSALKEANTKKDDEQNDASASDQEEQMDVEQEPEFQLAEEFSKDVERKELLESQDQEREEQSDLYSHLRHDEMEQGKEEAEEALDELKDITKEIKQNLNVDKSPNHDSDEDDKEKEDLQDASKLMESFTPLKPAWVARSDESMFQVAPVEELGVDNDKEFETVTTEITPHIATAGVSKDLVNEWLKLCSSTADMAQSLTEQLRMIVEPTKASRLKGDFRTGKRLNMRKILPYIASHYRKDKIWLRRTRPSKRECEILLALDDSSSMASYGAADMAREALATIGQALSVLEIGQLGVIAAGVEPRIIHPLSPSITTEDGARILGELTFAQPDTVFRSLLHTAQNAYSSGSPTAGPLSKLLIIISDPYMHESKATMLKPLRDLREQNVFVVFLIVENAQKECSFLDMQIAISDENGEIVRTENLMDHFPFPFYILVRNLKNLPSVLCDALRQWFEMILK